MQQDQIKQGAIYEGVSGQHKKVTRLWEEKTHAGTPREGTVTMVEYEVVKAARPGSKGKSLPLGEKRTSYAKQFSIWAVKVVA